MAGIPSQIRVVSRYFQREGGKGIQPAENIWTDKLGRILHMRGDGFESMVAVLRKSLCFGPSWFSFLQNFPVIADFSLLSARVTMVVVVESIRGVIMADIMAMVEVVVVEVVVRETTGLTARCAWILMEISGGGGDGGGGC